MSSYFISVPLKFDEIYVPKKKKIDEIYEFRPVKKVLSKECVRKILLA
jgi:hypothetical protein